MTCRDMFGVGPAIADFGYNLRDPSWGVPLIPKLAVITIEFDKLREVCLSCKNVFNSTLVKMKSVCRQLETIITHAGFKSIQETECRLLVPLADNVAGNEF